MVSLNEPTKILIATFVALLCSVDEASAICVPCEIREEIETYPYIATKERAELIKSRYTSVLVGMTEPQVLAILGEPEERIPWYHPYDMKALKAIKNPRGFQYWYVIQRLTNGGSANDRDEKAVVIRFGLDEKVVEIYHFFDWSDFGQIPLNNTPGQHSD